MGAMLTTAAAAPVDPFAAFDIPTPVPPAAAPAAPQVNKADILSLYSTAGGGGGGGGGGGMGVGAGMMQMQAGAYAPHAQQVAAGYTPQQMYAIQMQQRQQHQMQQMQHLNPQQVHAMQMAQYQQVCFQHQPVGPPTFTTFLSKKRTDGP